jgi:hypothetical protein
MLAQGNEYLGAGDSFQDRVSHYDPVYSSSRSEVLRVKCMYRVFIIPLTTRFHPCHSVSSRLPRPRTGDRRPAPSDLKIIFQPLNHQIAPVGNQGREGNGHWGLGQSGHRGALGNGL